MTAASSDRRLSSARRRRSRLHLDRRRYRTTPACSMLRHGTRANGCGLYGSVRQWRVGTIAAEQTRSGAVLLPTPCRRGLTPYVIGALADLRQPGCDHGGTTYWSAARISLVLSHRQLGALRSVRRWRIKSLRRTTTTALAPNERPSGRQVAGLVAWAAPQRSVIGRAITSNAGVYLKVRPVIPRVQRPPELPAITSLAELGGFGFWEDAVFAGSPARTRFS